MTKQKILLAFFLLFITLVNNNAQDVLLTIDNKDITLDEFERIYKKNNKGMSANMQSPEEYLDLFIKFKLKVIEAENMGMDTTEKFLKEFNGYKEQLAKPYLEDKETKEEFMKEMYERMKTEVHVRHILIKLADQYTTDEMLARYKSALEIRQRIIDGEDFETVARATSDDPGVKINGGDLGWITAFSYPYSFESTAYNIKVGEIAMPVRTIYGFNIINKFEERPSSGQVKVAHIFIRSPQNIPEEAAAEAKSLAFSLYDSLKLGVDFGELALRHSDDKASAAKGGELPWVEIGKMIPEFEKVAFAIKNIGEYSKPFPTSYGWHLIKLLDKKQVGTYDEMKSEIKSKMSRGERARLLDQKYLEELKKKYAYDIDTKMYNKIVRNVDTSIFKKAWNPDKNIDSFDDSLFTIEGGGASVRDFSNYLAENQTKRPPTTIKTYVDGMFTAYLQDYFEAIEKETLPERFPEYKYILQEYHDGILLFELMDKMVWSKAVNDTSGLETFFNDHRKDYMWESRIEAIVVSCDSSVNMNAILKKSSRISSGKWDEEKLNKKFCKESSKCISLTRKIVEKGVDEYVDALGGNTGVGEVYMEDGKSNFVIVSKIIPPMEKELNETRGQVTSDYQDFLEKQWIKELQSKYKVKVNKEMLSKIE